MEQELQFTITDMPEPIFTITQVEIEQMETKQSSIEWLIEHFGGIENCTPDFRYKIDQAKEMHKQEILDAWEDGRGSFPTRNEEEYYDKTFGK